MLEELGVHQGDLWEDDRTYYVRTGGTRVANFNTTTDLRFSSTPGATALSSLLPSAAPNDWQEISSPQPNAPSYADRTTYDVGDLVRDSGNRVWVATSDVGSSNTDGPGHDGGTAWNELSSEVVGNAFYPTDSADYTLTTIRQHIDGNDYYYQVRERQAGLFSLGLSGDSNIIGDNAETSVFDNLPNFNVDPSISSSGTTLVDLKTATATNNVTHLTGTVAITTAGAVTFTTTTTATTTPNTIPMGTSIRVGTQTTSYTLSADVDLTATPITGTVTPSPTTAVAAGTTFFADWVDGSASTITTPLLNAVVSGTATLIAPPVPPATTSSLVLAGLNIAGTLITNPVIRAGVTFDLTRTGQTESTTYTVATTTTLMGSGGIVQVTPPLPGNAGVGFVPGTGNVINFNRFLDGTPNTDDLPFDGSMFEASGTYTITVTADGNNLSGTTREDSESLTFTRFVPAFIAVETAAPTDLPVDTDDNDRVISFQPVNGNRSVPENDDLTMNRNVYVVSTDTSLTFSVGGSSITALTGTPFIPSTADQSGATHIYQVYDLGVRTAGDLTITINGF